MLSTDAVQQTQELYYYRPWAKTQNKGYMGYPRKFWWDHSFAYDSSSFQDPEAHKYQMESRGAYDWKKDYIKILRFGKEGDKWNYTGTH
eukprot:CAMPEP_0184298542 /NCGR_PEP_ID=MMETSP1049-20130417/9335_1 /TAXON_ID=77928 /ORGANISM="Proteomonas sulcata, Strain CCMP704" /LENGTH=88 /DNA_ID=CAMNT_0026608701 /DNA_START=295 /DNA_END=561 /DNA_ORIENTATION=+